MVGLWDVVFNDIVQKEYVKATSMRTKETVRTAVAFKKHILLPRFVHLL